MVRHGLDVARLNFSHGDAVGHYKIVRKLRRAAAAAGKPVGLLADLQGPRFRIGEIEGGELEVKTGDRVTLQVGSKRCEPGSMAQSAITSSRSE